MSRAVAFAAALGAGPALAGEGLRLVPFDSASDQADEPVARAAGDRAGDWAGHRSDSRADGGKAAVGGAMIAGRVGDLSSALAPFAVFMALLAALAATLLAALAMVHGRRLRRAPLDASRRYDQLADQTSDVVLPLPDGRFSGAPSMTAPVDPMGNTIGVGSREGVGSTFRFAVDLPPAPRSTGAPIEGARPDGGLDVLLVEDVAINQELVRAVVEAKGHRVDVVDDGADAIMAVADKAYGLVLMDLQMPFVDGLSATRAIRALPEPCRSVPIVALSANVRADRTAAAMLAGMDGCLAKPLDFAALDAVLEAAARGTLRPPGSGSGACEGYGPADAAGVRVRAA